MSILPSSSLPVTTITIVAEAISLYTFFSSMSSTSDSTQTFKVVGVDVPYVGRSGLDRNLFEIASVSNLWEIIDVNLVNEVKKKNLDLGNPRHKITFGYLAGTPDQHTKVKTTIKEWERYAHISFVPSANVADATVRISFDPDDGNWSVVGAQHVAYAGSDEKTMNLGKLKPNGVVADDYERHVILHEFGHTLGLLHEHQSPAREGVITLKAGKYHNIISSTCPEFSNLLSLYSMRQVRKERVVQRYGKRANWISRSAEEHHQLFEIGPRFGHDVRPN